MVLVTSAPPFKMDYISCVDLEGLHKEVLLDMPFIHLSWNRCKRYRFGAALDKKHISDKCYLV